MRVGLMLCMGLLTACATVYRVAETTTHQSAKTVANAVVADRLSTASAAVTGATRTTVSTVVEISGCPVTVVCITKIGLGQIKL